MKRSQVFFVLLLLVGWTHAQTYKVSYLTADDGLSRNLVHCIFRDSKGFMWFGTGKGLDRYDGYDFIHYSSSQQNNYLPSDVVNCFSEDQQGNYWIGTENGLYFFSYTTGEILPAWDKLKVKNEYLKRNIGFITRDDKGQLWIGHDQGLSLIQIVDQEFTIQEVYKSNDVSALLVFNGNVYVGERNHVFRIVKDNRLIYNRVQSETKLNDLNGAINTLFYDNSFIWIGTANGLYRYDPVTESVQYFQHDPTNNASLTSNVITEIKRTKDGPLLVGTLIGLNIYDYQSNSFRRITSEKIGSSEVLNNNFISCIYVDDNIFWIGTEKGGVNKFTPDHQFFDHIYHQPNDPFSISRNPVNAIFEDSDGDLLVGTVEGGLNIRKKGQTGFKHYNTQPGNKNSLSHNSVSAICQDFNGDYWIGTWGTGLNFLPYKNKERPVFQQFVSESQNNNIVSNFVSAVVSDPVNKGVWVGTRSGVDFIQLPSKNIIHVLNELPQNKAIRFVTGLFIDKQRNLWVGTSNGLFCIDLKKSEINRKKISYKHFQYELSNPSSERIEKINCILQTKEGNLWFGSNGNGIYSLDKKTAEFTKIDDAKGLIDNVIYGMLEDEAGNLWLSTDKGLCAYNPVHNTFRNFTKADGLMSNQFYWDAFYKGKDGKMYFGHVGGITYFEPLKYSSQATVNKVVITRISVLNELIFPAQTATSGKYLRFDGVQLEKVKLYESDKTFSIEFSALSFQLPHKVKYAYRLKGFEDEWQEVTSDRRFANFTNISSGSYVFEVKCTNADGTWSNEVSSLQINVVPPFYKSLWFLIIIFLLLIYAIYYFITYRIRNLKEQEIHLKQLVEERTQKIELQKKKLEEQSRQVQEATFDKISFFTNITHEFRTPITLILGPVERALKLSTNPKVIEQLNIVRRNSKLLLSLINQLMDFRKIESDKMELSKSYHDFAEFLDDIIIPFEDLSNDRQIIFRKHFRIHPPELYFDKDSMQKVLSNLLSNALKFTPDKGIISVIASTYTDKSDLKEKLYVAVKNTGKCIPDEDLEKIFEKFYQSKHHNSLSGYGQSGTGIGLFLCKKLIELNNGKIEAINLQEGGVSFRFIIPIDNKNGHVLSEDMPEEKFTDEQIEESEMNVEGENQKSKPTLLIVEDNADMRQYVRSLLIDEYNILEAANGVIGLEMTNRHQPDIILSDIMMPEMDGIELCKQIKSNFAISHIPVVLLTAKSSTETQIESLRIGADAFLTKPFDESLLRAVINNLNDKRNKTQINFAEKMDTSVLNFTNESQDKKFLDKALDVIRENYTNPDFDVTEFIDAMAISRSLLHKKLTSLAGQSASRFIRTYRLNMAREMIIKNRVSHSLNISEIAYQVGFNDPKYFTRCFTKQFGIQPSAYLEEK